MTLANPLCFFFSHLYYIPKMYFVYVGLNPSQFNTQFNYQFICIYIALLCLYPGIACVPFVITFLFCACVLFNYCLVIYPHKPPSCLFLVFVLLFCHPPHNPGSCVTVHVRNHTPLSLSCFGLSYP